MTKWHKTEIQIRNRAEKEPVPIVSDAIIATRGIADGRIIPVLIIDTSLRPDIEDMIRAHKHLGAGDVKSSWSIPSRFNVDKISLILTVLKHSQCVIILEFNIVRKGGIVDQIIHAQGVCIQPGKEGDRLSTTIDHERLLVEVPSKHFRDEWSKILHKALSKDFKRKGLSRSDSKTVTTSFIKEWREFGSKRMWPI
ncbi:MAG: hypothetical protein WC693_06305 [Patescibacteria group bacterium]|jgi:hypothetical protein